MFVESQARAFGEFICTIQHFAFHIFCFQFWFSHRLSISFFNQRQNDQATCLRTSSATLFGATEATFYFIQVYLDCAVRIWGIPLYCIYVYVTQLATHKRIKSGIRKEISYQHATTERSGNYVPGKVDPSYWAFSSSLIFGFFKNTNTRAQTPSIAAAPTLYAISLPAHQNNVQNRSGPIARPA